MEIASNFNFDGIARMGYGWSNPNHAAAVIGCFIPTVWAIEDIYGLGKNRLSAKYLTIAFEMLLLVLMVKTYSRGGMLGLCAAMIFYII